jgi:hypothetical protein
MQSNQACLFAHAEYQCTVYVLSGGFVNAFAALQD